MIKVVVFDDNKPRRDLLKIVIDSHEEYVCVNTYADCRNIIKNISLDKPDVILMDIDMPHVDGIEGLKAVRSHFTDIKVVMQTIFEDEEKIFNAIMHGANGYILKKATSAKILDAIKEVVDGGAPMTPSVANQVLLLFANKHKTFKKKDFNLSHREHEILSLLIKGYSYKMIADECFISYNTVNSHIKKIYEKLHVSSGTEAVVKAIQHKIV